MKGWSLCAEAENGQDAVQKALDLNPDVVLLDVSMPNLNGFEAAEIIKTNPPNSPATAHEMIQSAIEFLDEHVGEIAEDPGYFV